MSLALKFKTSICAHDWGSLRLHLQLYLAASHDFATQAARQSSKVWGSFGSWIFLMRMRVVPHLFGSSSRNAFDERIWGKQVRWLEGPEVPQSQRDSRLYHGVCSWSQLQSGILRTCDSNRVPISELLTYYLAQSQYWSWTRQFRLLELSRIWNLGLNCQWYLSLSLCLRDLT